MIIGILGLQGAFFEHATILEQLKVRFLIVNKKEHFKKIDALIIPGGESSVMGKFLETLDLLSTLQNFIFTEKKPVFGTCAGAILLSRTIIDRENINQGLIPSIDCEIVRNPYGSHINSFIESIQIKNIGWYDCVFIRAPRILNCHNCKVWASCNDCPIMISNENILLCTFHPELINSKIHKLFINQFIKKPHNIEE